MLLLLLLLLLLLVFLLFTNPYPQIKVTRVVNTCVKGVGDLRKGVGCVVGAHGCSMRLVGVCVGGGLDVLLFSFFQP
jgi:hypothetical protein